MNPGRLPDIIGAELKSAREDQGLDRKELATKCCLSSKMILELEEGGMTSFYTFELKLSAAKRVGAYLGLSQADFLHEKALPIEHLGDSEIPNSEPVVTEAVDKPQLNLPSLSPTVDLKNSSQVLLDGPPIAKASDLSEFHIVKRFKAVPTILFAVLFVGLLFGINRGSEISEAVLALVNRGHVKPPPVQQEALGSVNPESKEDQPNPAVNNPEPAKPVEQVAVVAPQGQCPYIKEDQLASYQSPNPSKVGDTVNIKTLIKQTICVTDAIGKQVVTNLEANTAQAFKGVAPFTILSHDLESIEMYYQGWRVRSPKSGANQIKLVEASLQQTP